MIKLYLQTIGEYIEVSEEGRFQLPSREYSPAELKGIAREVNRAFRNKEITKNLKI